MSGEGAACGTRQPAAPRGTAVGGQPLSRGSHSSGTDRSTAGSSSRERRWGFPAVLGRVLPPLTTVSPLRSLRCSVSCEGGGVLEKHRQGRAGTGTGGGGGEWGLWVMPAESVCVVQTDPLLSGTSRWLHAAAERRPLPACPRCWLPSGGGTGPGGRAPADEVDTQQAGVSPSCSSSPGVTSVVFRSRVGPVAGLCCQCVSIRAG